MLSEGRVVCQGPRLNVSHSSLCRGKCVSVRKIKAFIFMFSHYDEHLLVKYTFVHVRNIHQQQNIVHARGIKNQKHSVVAGNSGGFIIRAEDLIKI